MTSTATQRTKQQRNQRLLDAFKDKVLGHANPASSKPIPADKSDRLSSSDSRDSSSTPPSPLWTFLGPSLSSEVLETQVMCLPSGEAGGNSAGSHSNGPPAAYYLFRARTLWEFHDHDPAAQMAEWYAVVQAEDQRQHVMMKLEDSQRVTRMFDVGLDLLFFRTGAEGGNGGDQSLHVSIRPTLGCLPQLSNLYLSRLRMYVWVDALE